MSKTKSRSPKSPRKTTKKRVSISQVEPKVIEFHRDFSPNKRGDLWQTNEEYMNAANEKHKETDQNESKQRRLSKNAYRKKIINEMKARRTTNNLIPVLVSRVLSTVPEEIVSETRSPEVIQIRRQSSSRSAPIPIPIHTRNARTVPVPQTQRGFLFRVYDTAKSLVYKKKGGINKSRKLKRTA